MPCNYNKRLALLRLKVSKRETNILSPESGNFRLVHISLRSFAEKPNKSLAYCCKVGQKSNPSSKIKVCTCCFLRFIVLFFCPILTTINKKAKDYSGRFYYTCATTKTRLGGLFFNNGQKTVG